MLTLLSMAILGMSVGFAAALLGLGGNVFIIPVLPMLIKVTLRETIATGILAVTFVTAFNTYKYHMNKMVDWQLGAKLIPTAFVMSFIAARYAYLVSDTITMSLFVGIVLLMIINLLFFKPKQSQSTPLQQNITGQVGAIVSGTMGGLTGVGMGMVLGPIMLIFNLTDHRKVSPTVNLLIFITCLSATLGNIEWTNITWTKTGDILPHYALLIAAFSIIGSKFGRKFNDLISPELRKRVLAIVLALIAIKTGLSF